MNSPILLFHYGMFQPLWQQEGIVQCGPRLQDAPGSLWVRRAEVSEIRAALQRRGHRESGVLVHYTDPFLMRSLPLLGLRDWIGPRLLVCGDLHHGPEPIPTLDAYLREQPHHSVLLAFNPILLDEVRRQIPLPIHCIPPGFFRYPSRSRSRQPSKKLVHVGSLGPHHRQRSSIVDLLMKRGRIPFEHFTTQTPEEAAEIYASHALVLNIPLNNDLNHRFFEIMGAGAPQIVYAGQELLGPLKYLAGRGDVFWCNQIERLEALVLELLADPGFADLVAPPPPQIAMFDLLKACFAPAPGHSLAPSPL